MAKKMYINTDQANYFSSRKMDCAPNIPVNGYHNVGDIIISSVQKDEIFGWVCVKEGVPGNWDVICDVRDVNDKIISITDNIENIINKIGNCEIYIVDIDKRINELDVKIDNIDKEFSIDIENINNNINNISSVNNGKLEEINNQMKELTSEVRKNASDEKLVDENLQDQIDDLKSILGDNTSEGLENITGIRKDLNDLNNQVIQNALNEKAIDDSQQNQIDSLITEVRKNASDEKLVDENLQDQIDDLKEKDIVLEGQITMIKKGLVDALIENGVEVDMNTSWKDLFDGILDNLSQGISCTGLSLNKTELLLEKGVSETLIATKTPDNTTDNIIWLSGNDAIVNIDNEGTVTAISIGTTVITAICGSQLVTCRVSVVAKEIPCQELSLVQTDLEMEIGDSQILNAIVTPENTTDKIIWESDNDFVVTVDTYGTLIAKEKGNAIITAKCGKNTAQCNIVVKNKEILSTDITLNKTELVLEVGEEETLIATVLPVGCTETIIWSTNDDNIATVDQNGKVTAIGIGDVVITVTCGSKFTVCTVNVKAQNIDCTSISFSQASVNITQLANYDLNQLLNILPEDCNLPVEWYYDTDILTVENGIVAPLKNGSAKVQARCGGLSANITVIINVVEEEEPKPDNGIVLFKDGTVYNDTIFRNLCLASNDGINGIFSDYMYYNLTHSRQHMWLSFDGYVDFNNYDRVDVTLYTENSNQQPNLGIGIASKSGQCGYNDDSTWEGMHQSYKTVMTNKTKTTYSLDINYTGAGYLLLWMNNGETNISGGVYITEIVVYPKQETPVEKPCTSIYFNNTTGFKITGSETLDLNQYLVVQPEGCTDDVIWTTDSDAVAVSEGIVTVLKGGSAKVQARCGGYAATVTVEAVKEVGDEGIVLLSDGEYFNDTEFGSLCATPAIRDLIDSNGALVYEMNTIYTTAFFSFGGVNDSYVNFNNYDAVELTIYTENNNQVPYIQVCRTGGINGVPAGQFGYGSSPNGIMESTGFYVTTKKVPTVYTVNMAEIRKYEADMGNLLFIVERGETGDTADGKVYISKIVVYPEGTYYTEPIDE